MGCRHPEDECHIAIGSWLLASIPLNTGNGLGTLFSRSASRACTSAQAVTLIRPGFAWPQLVRGTHQLEWSFTFLELQEIDERGGGP